MYINKQTNYDEALRLAVTQDLSASDVGRDAGGSPIVLDLGNLKGQAVMLNLKIEAAGATTVYDVNVESSDDIAFGSGVYVEEVLKIDETAAVTAAKAYETRGFVPIGQYVRVSFVKTSGTLTDATAWASITG